MQASTIQWKLRVDNHRPFSTLAALALLVLLWGCEEKQPLSNGAIAALLREDRVSKCDLQIVDVRAGRFGLGRAQRIEAWFEQTVLTDPQFVHVTQHTDPDGQHGELSYRDHGDTYRIIWSQIDRQFDVESNQLSISACIYVPRSINIISVSFESDGHSARVLFQEELGLSLIGKRMDAAGVLQAYGPRVAPSGYEYVALLSRVGARDWRIRGVGVN